MSLLMNKLNILCFFAVSGLFGQAFAAITETTAEVTGVAPVITGVKVTNKSRPAGELAAKGDMLEAEYAFSDADGDTESNTLFKWVYDGEGAIAGATSATYTVKNNDSLKTIKVFVTPGTDPAVTLPDQGLELLSSNGVTVKEMYTLPLEFVTPLNSSGTSHTDGWTGAKNVCAGLGLRLPTVDELQNAFVQGTSATATGQSNKEMCTEHGWPLQNMCDGTTYSWQNRYWSSEQLNASQMYYVDMTNGTKASNDLGSAHGIACVVD
jgi:hypothetical protein